VFLLVIGPQNQSPAASPSESPSSSYPRALSTRFWQEPEVLALVEVATSQELGHNAERHRYPSPIYPKALLSRTSIGLNLVTLSAKGILYSLPLPDISSLRAGESVLGGNPAERVLSLEVSPAMRQTCTLGAFI
jgi:hypothetical protein